MSRVSRLVGGVALVVLLAVMFGAGWLTGTLGYGSEVDSASLTDLERQFADRMRGVRMVGRFTMDGREDQPAQPDDYFIESVEKVGDDRWRFTARIGYSGSDVLVPLVVTMRWIGDTPMMMLTDFEIPGMGTFTVRLFYHGDHYAGTWQNARGAGGHMFGRMETGP
jgi:hypothetical protein